MLQKFLQTTSASTSRVSRLDNCVVIASLQSDLIPTIPDCSSSGTTSRGPYKVQEVKNSNKTLRKIQRGVQGQGTSWRTYVVTDSDMCCALAGKSCYGHTLAITIDILPDDVLLEIFDWCRMGHDPDQTPFSPIWIWHGLVHVCQRWRQLVFGSSRRLDLQIFCTNGTPVMENLDFWPPLPIAIHYTDQVAFTDGDEDSLFTAVRLARALSPKAFIFACFGRTCSDFRLGYFRRIFASCRSRPSFLPLILLLILALLCLSSPSRFSLRPV